MIKYIKEKTGNARYIVLISVFLWMAISNAIQAFKCPKMSQTELLIHMPKSFVCDWQHCS
jgi:hypothetical protein